MSCLLLLLGWGELACETRLNVPNRVLGGCIGTENGSKSSELGPELPRGVHDRSQCATIGANPITLLLEPNQPKPGTQPHSGIPYMGEDYVDTAGNSVPRVVQRVRSRPAWTPPCPRTLSALAARSQAADHRSWSGGRPPILPVSACYNPKWVVTSNMKFVICKYRLTLPQIRAT